MESWHYTNPMSGMSSKVHTPQTPRSRLPEVEPIKSRKGLVPVKRIPKPPPLQRENSWSKIPRPSDRNTQYAKLHQMNAKAQKDIDEINRQIKLYKKLNRSQR